jgi:hypothetical protein
MIEIKKRAFFPARQTPTATAVKAPLKKKGVRLSYFKNY